MGFLVVVIFSGHDLYKLFSALCRKLVSVEFWGLKKTVNTPKFPPQTCLSGTLGLPEGGFLGIPFPEGSQDGAKRSPRGAGKDPGGPQEDPKRPEKVRKRPHEPLKNPQEATMRPVRVPLEHKPKIHNSHKGHLTGQVRYSRLPFEHGTKMKKTGI